MSYFRKNIDELEGYIPGFQPKGSDFIKLNTNENPYPPSPQAVEAIRNFDPELLRRYPQPLADTFRNTAADVLNVSPQSIIPTNGGDDLLTICFRAFCSDGRPAAFAGPTYSLYPVLAKLQNCKSIEIPFDDDYSLPADKLVASNASMVIVCNPNAPTGSFVAPQELKKLADRLNSKSVLLIDEAYADFAEENCISLINSCDNIIILRSMSKGYSLAGLRFGYGVGSETIIEGLRKVKDSFNVDAIAIAAASAAIWDQGYFKENTARVISERTRLTKALIEIGIEVQSSQANFVLAKFITVNAESVYKELAARNIFIRYFKLPGLEDKLRITVGTKKQNDALLLALKKILSNAK